MSIPEALKGAQAELARLHSPLDKLKRIGTYARIIGAELLGTVAVIPYGIRAKTLHSSLPEAERGTGRQGVVSLARNVRYGDKARSTMDVYLPPDADVNAADLQTIKNSTVTDDASTASTGSKTADSGLPVVLFCHGGVWAQGDKWHYAPMATRLAQAGIITAVFHYTLYPQALAPEMTEEVSKALTWTMDHIGGVGGDAKNLTLVGHSAGAQLCAMALLHRAVKEEGDLRMPKRLVGLAGVYDLAQHFEYERTRDVHELSTMARAVGGAEGFADASPCVILRDALARDGSCPGTTQPFSENAAGSKREKLHGEIIAERVGLHRPSTSAPAARFYPQQKPNLKLSVAAARRLPPTVLQSSCSDVVVPWYESADMHWALHDCGVPVKSLVYNRTGHGDFVVEWHPLPSPLEVHSTSDLPPYAADLVKILRDETNVEYARAGP